MSQHVISSLPPVVFILPITPKYEIYLIREYRSLLDAQILGIIGGSIKPGETVLQAAKRELEEETGITAKQWEMFASIENTRAEVRIKGFMYIAKDLELGTPHLEEDEEIELVKMPLSEAVEKVMNGEIYHSPSMTGILMLAELKRRKQL